MATHGIAPRAVIPPQAFAGTAQDVLEKFAEKKREIEPQGFFPHLYTGGMPDDEATRNLRHFGRHCLPELQRWPAPEPFVLAASTPSC